MEEMAITGACFPFSDKPKWILLVLSPWDPQCCLHPIAHNSTHRPATLHWLWPTSRSARQPNNHLNWYTNLSKPKKSDQLTQKQIYSYIVMSICTLCLASENVMDQWITSLFWCIWIHSCHMLIHGSRVLSIIIITGWRKWATALTKAMRKSSWCSW